jgi:hypothetical protein
MAQAAAQAARAQHALDFIGHLVRAAPARVHDDRFLSGHGDATIRAITRNVHARAAAHSLHYRAQRTGSGAADNYGMVRVFAPG